MSKFTKRVGFCTNVFVILLQTVLQTRHVLGQFNFIFSLKMYINLYFTRTYRTVERRREGKETIPLRSTTLPKTINSAMNFSETIPDVQMQEGFLIILLQEWAIYYHNPPPQKSSIRLVYPSRQYLYKLGNIFFELPRVNQESGTLLCLFRGRYSVCRLGVVFGLEGTRI